MDPTFRARLSRLREPFGGERRELRVGRWRLSLGGLDASLAGELEGRWGPFLEPAGQAGPGARIDLVDGGEQGWLSEPPRPGELYRIEARGEAEHRVVASYHFALAAGAAAGEWTLAVTRGAGEPAGRIVENAARFVLAGLALDEGGFAMHAAGVLHGGRAFLYAGPSRAGKSTAVAASAPAASLGDDFALVVRDDRGWWAPALPFDGSERIGPAAVRGLFPVGAIWRLYHGEATRVEHPSARVAAASLLSCAAFPWTYPERAGRLLDHVNRFVEESRFAHLYFAPGADLHADVLWREGDGR